MTAAPPLHPVLAETPLTPSGAAALLVSTKPTVIRWLNAGCPVNGTVVKLDGLMVGGRWRTSREAVARFLEACRTAKRPKSAEPTPAQRKRRNNRAERELKRLGC